MFNSSPLRVFVYGTLKPGEENYPRYCEGAVSTCLEAIALGTLYDLPLGYPALTPGDQPVQGYLLTFTDPDRLSMLDELEGYEAGRSPAQNDYQRDWLEVWDRQGGSLGRVWVYRMSLEQVRALGGTLLESGRWTGNPVSNFSPEDNRMKKSW